MDAIHCLMNKKVHEHMLFICLLWVTPIVQPSIKAMNKEKEEA